jgi:hypothetical protein
MRVERLFFPVIGAISALFFSTVVFSQDPPPLTPSPVLTRIQINLPSRELTLWSHSEILKRYPVAIGRPQFPTPIGQFHIVHRIENPVWENPYMRGHSMRIPAGQKNPLGSRWLGFAPGKAGEYGLHGTDRDASIGQAVSHGCIRMHTRDIEAFFSDVPLGLPVDITYTTLTFELGPEQQIIMTHFPDVYHREPLWTLAMVSHGFKAVFPEGVLDEARLQQWVDLKFPLGRFIVGRSLPRPPFKE